MCAQQVIDMPTYARQAAGEIKKEILEAHFLKENKYIKHMGAKINVQVATTDSGVKVLYTPIFTATNCNLDSLTC